MTSNARAWNASIPAIAPDASTSRRTSSKPASSARRSFTRWGVMSRASDRFRTPGPRGENGLWAIPRYAGSSPLDSNRRLTYGGMPLAVGPRNFEMTEPNDGRPPTNPVCVSWSRWSDCPATTLRTTASLSHIFAWSGNSSQMSTPGTFERIGLNSPR